MQDNLISKTIEIVGLRALARLCDVSPGAIYKWQRKGTLPRTDWTGETDYASRIEEATKGAVTRDQLLNFKRSGETDSGKPHQDQA